MTALSIQFTRSDFYAYNGKGEIGKISYFCRMLEKLGVTVVVAEDCENYDLSDELYSVSGIDTSFSLEKLMEISTLFKERINIKFKELDDLIARKSPRPYTTTSTNFKMPLVEHKTAERLQEGERVERSRIW